MEVKRGDILFVDLGDGLGSEQMGGRPVLVVQNDVGNKYSTTTIVASITSKLNKAKLPTHVFIPKKYGLTCNSIVMMEQLRTIDKARIYKKSPYELSEEILKKIDAALKVSLNV